MEIEWWEVSKKEGLGHGPSIFATGLASMENAVLQHGRRDIVLAMLENKVEPVLLGVQRGRQGVANLKKGQV